QAATSRRATLFSVSLSVLARGPAPGFSPLHAPCPSPRTLLSGSELRPRFARSSPASSAATTPPPPPSAPTTPRAAPRPAPTPPPGSWVAWGAGVAARAEFLRGAPSPPTPFDAAALPAPAPPRPKFPAAGLPPSCPACTALPYTTPLPACARHARRRLPS